MKWSHQGVLTGAVTGKSHALERPSGARPGGEAGDGARDLRGLLGVEIPQGRGCKKRARRPACSAPRRPAGGTPALRLCRFRRGGAGRVVCASCSFAAVIWRFPFSCWLGFCACPLLFHPVPSQVAFTLSQNTFFSPPEINQTRLGSKGSKQELSFRKDRVLGTATWPRSAALCSRSDLCGLGPPPAAEEASGRGKPGYQKLETDRPLLHHAPGPPAASQVGPPVRTTQTAFTSEGLQSRPVLALRAQRFARPATSPGGSLVVE